ncbi:alpha/beta fold hydrolase [Patulibacter defluvii]|uniref:alpha/beta fold hydrolase n=1 Tax=Patulibacter defluvii TaxID=3095358 RepID=UPI002A75A13B|nr:alpha/beta fold hydrolase [Patulibacter sp. DM4]
MTIAPLHRGGDGTPLVLLHGFTGSWRVWRPLMPALEAHHDVLAPSLPGHAGAAPPPPAARLGVPSLVDAVEAQLDAAGIATAHLAGNSLGGWVALELARRGRARSVVALSPAGAWSSRRDLDRVIRIIRGSHQALHRAPALSDRLLRQPWARRIGLRAVAERGDHVPLADALDLVADARACTIVPAFLDWVAGDRPLRGGPPLDAPLTVAWAERDRTLPFDRYGRPWLEASGAAELVRLRGVGHVPMLDDPALVARTILNAARRVDHAHGALQP